jgi:hypothetical protein
MSTKYCLLISMIITLSAGRARPKRAVEDRHRRSELNAARISVANSTGSSHAAK